MQNEVQFEFTQSSRVILAPNNFNDNWLTYKEGYNYYEDIELFYSKL